MSKTFLIIDLPAILLWPSAGVVRWEVRVSLVASSLRAPRNSAVECCVLGTSRRPPVSDREPF
jgi:hypothetical protein